MCGIVYSKSFIGKPVNKTIVQRYLDQRDRGTEGFGFYIPDGNRLTHNIREGRILTLLNRRRSDEILFHHRFPTSTLNVRNGCHPYSTKEYFDNNYILVHNGTLVNDDLLKAEHEKLGIQYVSEQYDGRFNDSEALLWDVALYLEGEQTELKAKGNIAFIVIKRDSKGTPVKLHFGHNSGSPLRMQHNKKGITLSSESKTKSDEWVDTNRLFTLDYKTLKLTSEHLTIPSSYPYGFDTNYCYNSNWEDSMDTIGESVLGNPFSKEKSRILAVCDYVYDDALAQTEWEIEELRKEIYKLSIDKVQGNITYANEQLLDSFIEELETLEDVAFHFEEMIFKYANPRSK